MNWIPGLSQIKSAVQLVTLDFDGALETQEDFFQQCPVVSQVTSTVQLVCGDKKGALETQKKCLGIINGVANGVPLLGHSKSLIHLAFGDKKGAKEAFKSSSRTTAVMGSGVAGFFIGGPAGAIAAGITGGATMDSLYSAIAGKSQGHFATIVKILKDEHKGGSVFDLVAGVVFDGLAGQTAGQMVGRVIGKQIQNSAVTQMEKIDPLMNPELDVQNIKGGDLLQQHEALSQQFKYGESLQGIEHTFDKFNDPVTVQTSVKPCILTDHYDEEKRHTLSTSHKHYKYEEKETCRGHTLLTKSEAAFLLQAIEELISEHGLKENELDSEIVFNSYRKTKLGGSYYELNREYPGRTGKFEVNHLPPKSFYSAPYDQITDGKKPAHIMSYADHKMYETTGGNRFSERGRNRSFIKIIMQDLFLSSRNMNKQSGFCSALYYDLSTLLKDRQSIKKYSNGMRQLIAYCLTPIEGAPCNRDCPNF